MLGLTPEEFGRMTLGEYQAKLKGYDKKLLIEARYISLAFNDPKKLNELEMIMKLQEGRD